MHHPVYWNILVILVPAKHAVKDHPAGRIVSYAIVQPGPVILASHDVGRRITPDPVGRNRSDGVAAVPWADGFENESLPVPVN